MDESARTPAQPILCRLHLHHYVTLHDNPEDRHFASRHCTRCGHVKDLWQPPKKLADSVARDQFFINGN